MIRSCFRAAPSAVGLALVALTLAAPHPTLAQAPVSGDGMMLDPQNLDHWTTVRASQVTPDGQWVAVQFGPNEGDGEVMVMRSDGADERRWPVGETGGGSFLSSGASVMSLSSDGRWFAFTRYPTMEASKAAESSKKRVTNGVTVVNLQSGEERAFDGIDRYEFAGEAPQWLVMSRVAVEDAPRGMGTDLLLLDLASGRVTTIGSVGSFDLSPTGEWLAWVSQSPDRVGNGISLRNLTTGVVQTLDSEPAVYSGLNWADEGPDGRFATALSALRGMPDSAAADTSFVAVGFTGFGESVQMVRVDATELSGFPAGMRIAPARTPSWSNDRSTLFFGIAEAPAEPTSEERPDVRPVAGVPGAMQTPPPSLDDEDDLPTLVLWHGRDPDLQSRQQVQENSDRRFTFLSAYHVSDGRFVRLATEEVSNVDLNDGQRYAVGEDRRAYQLRDGIDGGQRRDVLAIDVRDGSATPVLEAQRWGVYPSPDGQKLLYYRDGHYHVYDIPTSTHSALTEGAPVRFIDVDDDHNVEDPPIAPLGWTDDSRSVLLSDGWDVWQVATEGGDFVNLTGDGREQEIRYRRPLRVDPDMAGWDLDQPLYLEAYGERTKKQGLVRLSSNGRRLERLVWDDAYFTMKRARDAETFVFTRETFQQFPDIWAATGSFQRPTRLTDLNPQQADYAWSAGARLVEYTSDHGVPLQAAMFLPAGYQEGQQYPTVVYIYEKLSQNLHRYVVPDETRAFNPSVYTSRGYVVLMPDIVYEVNDPGMSAVWSVLPAVDAAIATGAVDPDNVGLHGHSWGGYQTAFLVTQTDKFKSVVAGAALTDMVSMYHSVYWNSGNANQGIFESSQGRFFGSPAENYDAYIRNSPVFHVENVKSPVLLLHNEKDGAVDFNQGITYFNALREAEKEVVLLQYVGENHGLREPMNQRDYTVRMWEYFDHHLKGLPAPEWWTDGVPRLEMNAHLKSRKTKPKVIS
jgi:dipeptidyl aminopeptidase/acylaminoacyl peptidase